MDHRYQARGEDYGDIGRGTETSATLCLVGRDQLIPLSVLVDRTTIDTAGLITVLMFHGRCCKRASTTGFCPSLYLDGVLSRIQQG